MDRIRGRRNRLLYPDEEEHQAKPDRKHEYDILPLDRLLQEPWRQYQDVERRGGLEINRVGSCGKTIRQHEERKAGGIGDTYKCRTPELALTLPRGQSSPGMWCQQQQRERGETGTKAGDLPTGKSSSLDCRATG